MIEPIIKARASNKGRTPTGDEPSAAADQTAGKLEAGNSRQANLYKGDKEAMKCSAVLNLTKADTVKRLISYGVTPKEARKAVSDLERNQWRNNDTTANGTTFVICYNPAKKRKYEILFQLGVNFTRAYKGA